MSNIQAVYTFLLPSVVVNFVCQLAWAEGGPAQMLVAGSFWCVSEGLSGDVFASEAEQGGALPGVVEDHTAS